MDKYDGATIEDHDRGLSFDLPRLVSRRTAVGLLAGGVGSVIGAGMETNKAFLMGRTMYDEWAA